jgi:cation diffusion facilitator family transporter
VFETLESNYKLRTLELSAIAISSVVAVEIILGLIVRSLAIVSDGLHALLDALTTVMLLVATRMSLKPPDKEHMYGHEKFESIGGLVGGIALLGIALLILYEAVLRVLGNMTINFGLEYVGFVAVGFTFCVDFFRVSIFRRARNYQSSTMKVGLYHAVADLGSTIIAFAGFGFATLGVYYGDSLASIVLSILLFCLSVKLVLGTGTELTDTISKDVADRVREEILGTQGVRRFKDLKIRKAGEKTFVRATLEVPDYLGLEEAHDLTSRVEAKIKKVVGNADVTIHTEPYETEMPTEGLIEKLATELQGVRKVHDVNTVYADGKLYVTLHALVHPKLSVEEAHEIAERIEDKIEEKVRDVENVTVHVEPFSPKERKGSMVGEEEIRKIVQSVAEGYQHALRVKRIVTYVASKKRYINIDCCFTRQISVEEAHEAASQIEENLKEHFADTTVTVHMEPS